MTPTTNAVTMALRIPRVGLGLGVIALVGLVILGAAATRTASRRSPRG